MTAEQPLPDDLDLLWRDAAAGAAAPPPPPLAALRTARDARAQSIADHVGTTVILAITAGVLVWFFTQVLPLGDGLSRAGIALMLGSLGIRIAGEGWSLRHMLRVDPLAPPATFAAQSLRAVRCRKAVHGRFMVATIACYTLGYALLNPAFVDGLGIWTVVGLDVVYVAGAAILIKYLGGEVRAEHAALRRLEEVSRQLGDRA